MIFGVQVYGLGWGDFADANYINLQSVAGLSIYAARRYVCKYR